MVCGSLEIALPDQRGIDLNLDLAVDDHVQFAAVGIFLEDNCALIVTVFGADRGNQFKLSKREFVKYICLPQGRDHRHFDLLNIRSA